ncbi:hypothetical protein, partial [Streptomyces thermocarboxydus]
MSPLYGYAAEEETETSGHAGLSSPTGSGLPSPAGVVGSPVPEDEVASALEDEVTPAPEGDGAGRCGVVAGGTGPGVDPVTGASGAVVL